MIILKEVLGKLIAYFPFIGTEREKTEENSGDTETTCWSVFLTMNNKVGHTESKFIS
jgi:hypothetical protein